MRAQANERRAGGMFLSGIALAVALVWAASEPRAQDAQLPGDAAAPEAEAEQAVPAEEQPDTWTKYCNTDPEAGKNLCIVQMNLVTDEGQFLASIQLRETEGEARKRLIAAVPPGVLLQPGVQIQVDKEKPVPLQYSICFPNACYAETVVEDAHVAAMKKGTRIVLTALDQQSRPRPFPFSLADFAEAYDGPGLSPDQADQHQRDLQQKLRELAEEKRRKLGAEQETTPEPKQ